MVNHSYAQTADVSAGCAPLVVSFDAPSQTNYYWEFGDGAQSVDQNPDHTYTAPGSYTAVLFDSQGGTKVGEVVITVYEPLRIDFSSDVISGCGPLTVNFTPDVTVPNGITVNGYVWSFGDGNTSNSQNASYTFSRAGTYSVSLRVDIGDDINCEDTHVKTDFIYVEGTRASFTSNKKIDCNIPADFIFKNTSDENLGDTYAWTFGDGQIFSGFEPGSITYNSEGLFDVELTITTPAGCVSRFTRAVNIGSPVLNFGFQDTLCAFQENILTNNTIADEYVWDFSSAADAKPGQSLDNEPRVTYEESGFKTITVTAISDQGCETTETFTVFVEKPDASFTIGPDLTCMDSFTIMLTANDPNMVSYTWTNFLTDDDGQETTDPFLEQTYVHPERDSLYINYPDTTFHSLIVESVYGCKDTVLQDFIIQKPEAFFIPDVIGGCVPFTVNFADFSTTPNSSIQIREWDFGDGTTVTLGENDTEISHEYTTGGIHYVTLTITDEGGCIDISKEFEIYAIEKPTIPPFR